MADCDDYAADKRGSFGTDEPVRYQAADKRQEING